MKPTSTILVACAAWLLLCVAACRQHDKPRSSTVAVDTQVVDNQPDTVADTVFFHYADSTGKVTKLSFGGDGSVHLTSGKLDKFFHRHPTTGVEYRFVQRGSGTVFPQPGDVLVLDMTYKTETDSLLFVSADVDKDFKMRLTPPTHPASIQHALMMLRTGDSASFRIDAIDFFTKTQERLAVPNFINKGDKLIFNVRLRQIIPADVYAQQNSDDYKRRINSENNLIERYVLDYDFPLYKSTSGLRLFTIQKGTGTKIKSGDKVTLNYTVGFIDGGIFDSTLERNEPFSFVVGQKQVIDGLDEAVSLMNVGDHCLSIIPFYLAYGSEKHGVIPPYSTLVFETEILYAH